MSDMKNLYKAYAAVHDESVRDSLNAVRDEISEMNLTQLTDVDLQEVAEEILEGLFGAGFEVAEVNELVGTIFKEAYKGEQSEKRYDKVDRLEEAFKKALHKVTDKSPVNAIESYLSYRKSKPLTEKWANRVNHEHGNEKVHGKVVAEDREVVLKGLQQMIEKIIEEDSKWGYDKKGRSKNPADVEERRRKDDDLFGSPNKKKGAAKLKEEDDESAEERSHKNIQEKINKGKISGAAYGHATALYKDQWKDRKIADYDKEHGKDKRAKEMRADAEVDRKRMWAMTGDKWKHAKYASGEEKGKKNIKGNVKEESGSAIKDPTANPVLKKELKSLRSGIKGKSISIAKADTLKGVGEEVVLEKDLSAKERRALPDSDFALPGKGKGPEGKQAGSYPIPDKNHARLALAMVAKYGTPEEKSKVRAAVEKKFPGIKVSEEVQRLVNSEKFSPEEILRLISD